MMLQANSQTSSIPRVQTLINAKGDTLIQLSLVDAKVILTELLSKSYADSLIVAYENKDSIQHTIITLQKTEIDYLKDKFNNQLSITQNLEQVLRNKDKEIEVLNSIINKQKKEINKQKTYKLIGFIAAIVLPITIILFQ